MSTIKMQSRSGTVVVVDKAKRGLYESRGFTVPRRAKKAAPKKVAGGD